MKERGFSLIEMVVVVVLLSLAVALVAPSLSKFSRSVELKAAAKKVSGILRYYRSEAVNKGQVFRVFFDPDLREVKVQPIVSTEEKGEDNPPQKIYSLPQGIQMKEIKLESPQYPSDFPTVEFYPNGGSNGGTILLDSEDRKGYRIKIHFLTGTVQVESV
jgi:general secretion pathway protein H